MNTTLIGQAAEAAVAKQLTSDGYKILDKNWKTKVCEIDLVATKDHIIFFVEVKYRSSETQGTGLDYIGAHKLKRLKFAADVWVSANDYSGDYRLMAASVHSNQIGNFIVDNLFELE